MLKKKILFIITQSEFGGAQRAFFNIITNLNKEKYEITAAAGPEGDDKNGLLYALKKNRINTRHLKYLRRAINPCVDFLGLIEIYKLIKKEKPNIIFLGSSKAGFLGGLAAKNKNIKIIYRIGGWAFNDPLPNWKKKMYIWLEKWSAKFKDIIIINSERDRKQAIDLKIKPRKNIITIYNGIDINKLEFLSKDKARKEIFNFFAQKKPTPGQQLIGTIANLYPSKNLGCLIKSASILTKKYPKLIFVVIGEGRERKKLENLIKKYKLENNFFLIGAIPNAYQYLKAFDLFALSSVKEGFPWTILEAMTAEVPIVATKVAAIPEVLENKKTALLVEPSKPKELAKAIEELIANDKLRNKISQKANIVAKEKFSLNKMVKEIESLF